MNDVMAWVATFRTAAPVYQRWMDAQVADEELVSRTLAGDTSAFELIVSRHMPGVWRYARYKLNDACDAEEVASDTFLRAHHGLVDVRQTSSLGAWLLRICHRLCVDRLRRRRLTTVPPDDTVLSVTAVLEDRHQQRVNDLRSRFQQEIARLPEEERDAFMLVCIHGYSREEAASILNVPPSTMRSRVIRVRALLAEKLGDCRTEMGGG